MNGCLSTSELEQLHAGELDPAREVRALEHLACCDRCVPRDHDLRGLIDRVGERLRKLPPLDEFEDAAAGGPGLPAWPKLPEVPGHTLLEEIHRGGQGVVYRARKDSTGRQDKARFEREVAILAMLDHPNIVTIHDSGICDSGFFYVMDYIEGVTLDAYAAGGVDRRSLLGVFLSICQAVSAAHLRGVIHRDLKPANILVTPGKQPHILDFGLAKMASTAEGGSPRSVMTVTGQFLGSPPWASPEQARGIADEIDLRTDVYALGVILYQLLTGRFPYPVVGSTPEVLNHIMHTPPARPSSAAGRRSGLDDELDTITLKCLSKEPERRYQSAGELARDIDRYLAGEPIEAKRDSTLYLLRKTIHRHRAATAVIGGFLILLIAFSSVLAMMNVRLSRERDVAMAERRRADEKSLEQVRSMYAQNIAMAHVSCMLFRADLMQASLNECPPELRGWEWGRLQYLMDNSLKHFPGTEGLLAISPDRSVIASQGDVGHVVIRDARSFKKLLDVRVFNSPLFFLTFSADGRKLLCYTAGGQARAVDLNTGGLGSDCKPINRLRSPVLSPDGWLGAIGPPGNVNAVQSFAWPALTLKWTTPTHTTGFGCLARSPDSRYLAAGDWRGDILLFDARTGAEITRWKAHDDAVTSLRFSPDGELLLSAGGDRRTHLWRIPDGAAVTSFDGYAVQGATAVFSPSGTRLASAGCDHAIRVWTLEGRLERTLRGHHDVPLAVEFVDEDTLVSAAPDGDVKVWNLNQRKDVLTWQSSAATAITASFAPDGRRFAVASYDGFVRVWPNNGLEVTEPLLQIHAHEEALAAVFSPDGTLLATSGKDGLVRLWDATTGEPVAEFTGHTRGVPGLAFVADGSHLVSGSWDRTCRLWDLSNGGHCTVLAHGDEIWEVACSPDSRWVAAAGRDGCVRLWDLINGMHSSVLCGHERAVDALAFSPDSRLLATGGFDGSIRIWDLAGRKTLKVMRSQVERYYSLAWRSDGRRLAASGRQLIEIWDPLSAALVFSFQAHSEAIYSVSFSQNGRQLLSSGSDGMARLWPASGESGS